jgi:L-arabinose isomerase
MDRDPYRAINDRGEGAFMRQRVKPKLGLLGIMHGLYDESQPEVSRNQEAFARRVVDRLKDVADIDFPGAAKTRAAMEKTVGDFNRKGYHGIMIINLLYSPGLSLVRALQNNNLPILLANVQPVPSVTGGWNWGDLTTNQGIHGAQDTANTLVRTGTTAEYVTEEWEKPAFAGFVEDWARAAATCASLRGMRIGVFNKLNGMGDILGDEAAFFRKVGPQVFYESVGEVYRLMQDASDTDIAGRMKENGKNFEIDPALKEESHRYAVKLQIGFERLLEEKGYDGFSAHFDVFQEDGRFEQIPILGASNIMAEGFGYAAEGDVATAAAVGSGYQLIGDTHFTEMYSLDYEKDSALMSHMGEGNWKIARKDRPVRLIDRPLEIGGLSNPPTPVFSAEPGRATMVSLAAISGDRYRLVVAGGDILDTEELKEVPMPYFHFKPDSGIRACMNGWLRNAGTHHQVINLGDHARRWKMLCSMLGIECVEV